jgi:hypothetical protein
MSTKNRPTTDSAKDDAAQERLPKDPETVLGEGGSATEEPAEGTTLASADSSPQKTPSSYDLTDEELSQAAAGGSSTRPR